METIIYTCITGGYDKLNEINTSYRAICFTDQKDLSSNTWEVVNIKFAPKIYRKIKICPHLFLPYHDRSIWVDGNLIFDDIDQLAEGKHGVWTANHPVRNCIYKEALKCIRSKKDKKLIILKQISKYYKKGYPFNNGLITSSVLIRTNSKENRRFAEFWWTQVKRYSVRDQISFNFAIWTRGIRYHTFPYKSTYKKVEHLK